MNYIAGELKIGKKKYIEEAKNLVNFGLESKLIFEDNQIESIVFINQIKIACGVNDLELAEEIIENYGDYIQEEDRNDTLIISQAYINLKKEQYDKVIEKLHLIKPSNRIMNLRTRLILMRAYAGAKEFDSMERLIDSSIKTIIRSNDLGVDNKKSALNTFKYAMMMLNPKIEIDRFRKNLEELQYVYCKNWMLEKIEDIRNY